MRVSLYLASANLEVHLGNPGQNVLGRVLRDRPLSESADFFKGFSRGLRAPVNPLVPKVVDGKPVFTPRQFKLMSTLVIYSAIVNH
jgi:hypothetical protein